MIQVEDIKKQYDDRIILDHFSLQIPKGKITSLIESQWSREERVIVCY